MEEYFDVVKNGKVHTANGWHGHLRDCGCGDGNECPMWEQFYKFHPLKEINKIQFKGWIDGIN